MPGDLVRAHINTDDPERRASIARLTRHLAEDAMARLAGDILNNRDKFPANDAIQARLENIARSMDLPDGLLMSKRFLRPCWSLSAGRDTPCSCIVASLGRRIARKANASKAGPNAPAAARMPVLGRFLRAFS